MRHNGKERIHEEKDEDKVNTVLSQVTARGKAFLNQGLGSAKDVLQGKAERLRAKVDEISEKTISEIGDDVKTYVRQNPVKSLVIAVGIGVMLASLFGPIKTKKAELS